MLKSALFSLNGIGRFAGVFVLLLAVVLLAACGDDSSSVANGTGSNAGETELAYGTVAVSAVDASGKPLARSSARIWNLEQKSLSVKWTGSLDEEGRVVLPKDSLNGRFMEIVSGDSLSALKWMNHVTEKVKVTLSGTETLAGRIVADGGLLNSVANVQVSVLGQTEITDAEGRFAFENVPAGIYYAFVQVPAGILDSSAAQSTRAFQVEAGVENLLALHEEDYILVENFENWERRRTVLGQTFGEGWWFISTDSLSGGNSKSAFGIWDDSLLVTEGAYSGNSFHAIFYLDENFEGHYATAGFSLGDDYYEDDMASFYDLSGMKGISFFARGNNRIYLQLTCENTVGERVYYDVPVELADDWRQFYVTADDFIQHNIDVSLAKVNSINFVGTEDVEFYLDDIRIEGISATAWPSLGAQPKKF